MSEFSAPTAMLESGGCAEPGQNLHIPVRRILVHGALRVSRYLASPGSSGLRLMDAILHALVASCPPLVGKTATVSIPSLALHYAIPDCEDHET